MPNLLTRIASIVVSVSVILDPAVACGLPHPQMFPATNLLTTQAFANLSLGHKSMVQEPGSVGVTWVSAGYPRPLLTRRAFLLASGGAASTILHAQPTEKRPLKKRLPLPFPKTRQPIPVEFVALIQRMKARTIQFQDSALSRAPSGSPVIAGNHQQRLDAYFAGMATDSLPLLYADLQSHEGYSEAKIAALHHQLTRASTPRESVEAFDILYDELLPAMFARHGLFLGLGWIASAGVSIPDLRLTPVLSEEAISETFTALGPNPIQAQRYRVGESQFRTLREFNGRFRNWIGYETRYGTRQIFFQAEGFNSQIRDLVPVYRQSIDSAVLKSVKDPFTRSRLALLKVGVENLSPNARTLSDSILADLLIAYTFRIATRHELVHVFDGVERAAGEIPAAEETALHEIRAELVSSIGFPNLALTVATLMTLTAGISLVDAHLADHGEDMVYIRQRLALALLKDRSLQERLRLSCPVVNVETDAFSSLSEKEQAAAWDTFPSIDQQGWEELYQQVWRETKIEGNPVARGLDLQPGVSDVSAPSRAPMFFSVGAIASGVALTWFVISRKMKHAAELLKSPGRPDSPTGKRISGKQKRIRDRSLRHSA